ncbi:MAG: FG-GAP-like repeat-containing protein [Gemmataceae bacterium]|nr:FG-GAP-like repeat-containing protein [Gemmataceae bacterium]
MSRRSSNFRTLGLMRLEERAVPSTSVIRWNTIALDAARDDHAIGGPAAQAGPTKTSRALAIVQTAVYDAVNSIDGHFQPYKFSVAAPAGASIPAAVAAAAHDTLVALYPAFQSRFDAALAADLAALPAAAANAGATVGHTVAAQVLASRASDGSTNNTPYTFINQPGFWSVDPLHPTQQPLTPNWGGVTPFTMTSGTQFRSPAPPALNSPEYTAAYNEVLAYGGDGIGTPTIRNAEQTEIGIYWGYDGQPGLCSPPRLYNQIASQIAQERGLTDVQGARYFALINMAMADAGIAGWETKYFYNLWRPVTAIRDAANDGNPNTVGNATWSPLGAPANNGNGTNFTPPFPAYVSGHATFGAALFRTIANYFGTDHVPFTFISDEFNGLTFDMNGVVRPVRARHFETLSQAAEENGQSRIYLGIHWSFDKTAGITQGTAIADNAFAHFLRAKPSTQRFVTGADAGGGPHVRVLDGAGNVIQSFFAYSTGFTGGVRVAQGDITGDGIADVITGPGPGGGPHIRVFDGVTGSLVREFFAYDSAFRSGVFVAAGDVNGDGKADIITGADAGGGPHVRVFSGADNSIIREFFAYSASFLGGVRVAAGDLDGDGKEEVITGAGPGGGPHVQAFNSQGSPVVSFFAYDPSFRGGVNVASGDCDGDGRADIVTGAGAGGGPHVQVYSGKGALLQSFFAFGPVGNPTTNGVRVGCADLDGDGRADLITAAGKGDAPLVECRDAADLHQIERSLAYDPTFLGGVFVGGPA